MDKPSLVRDRAVRAYKDIVGNCLMEDLDLEDVCNYLLRLAVDIRVYEHNMIVACDNISEHREMLLDMLEGDSVWKGVADVLELLVCHHREYEEPVTVAGGKTANDACAIDGGVHDGDDFTELCLKHRVEVGAALNGNEAVCICEL
jgi:hypothetical protein